MRSLLPALSLSLAVASVPLAAATYDDGRFDPAWVGGGAEFRQADEIDKIVDAATGETMVALHHRVVSGTNLSTTDSKLVQWVDEFAEEIGKKGIETLFRKGDRVKK